MFTQQSWTEAVPIYICPARRQPVARTVVDQDAWGIYKHGGWAWGRTDYGVNLGASTIGRSCHAIKHAHRRPVEHDPGRRTGLRRDRPGAQLVLRRGVLRRRPQGGLSGRARPSAPTIPASTTKITGASAHLSGVQFLFGDGSVRVLAFDIGTSLMATLMTPDGSEAVTAAMIRMLSLALIALFASLYAAHAARGGELVTELDCAANVRLFDTHFARYGHFPLKSIQREEHGLRFKLPSATKDIPQTGVYSYVALTGDFEVEAEFEWIDVTPPKGGYGVSCGIAVDTLGPAGQVSLARVILPWKKNTPWYAFTRGQPDESGKMKYDTKAVGTRQGRRPDCLSHAAAKSE